MPPFETMDRHQKAVYWEKTGLDRYGRPLVAEPEELSVRWLWAKRETADAQGQTVSVDATVVLAQDVVIGSLMWLGSLDDLAGTGTGDTPTGDIYQVVSLERTPDIKGRNVRREAGLQRYTDSMAEIG